jgi:hypothetical protein
MHFKCLHKSDFNIKKTLQLNDNSFFPISEVGIAVMKLRVIEN